MTDPSPSKSLTISVLVYCIQLPSRPAVYARVAIHTIHAVIIKTVRIIFVSEGNNLDTTIKKPEYQFNQL